MKIVICRWRETRKHRARSYAVASPNGRLVPAWTQTHKDTVRVGRKKVKEIITKTFWCIALLRCCFRFLHNAKCHHRHRQQYRSFDMVFALLFVFKFFCVTAVATMVYWQSSKNDPLLVRVHEILRFSICFCRILDVRNGAALQSIE